MELSFSTAHLISSERQAAMIDAIPGLSSDTAATYIAAVCAALLAKAISPGEARALLYAAQVIAQCARTTTPPPVIDGTRARGKPTQYGSRTKSRSERPKQGRKPRQNQHS
jgi:hypothetical protein